MLSTPSFVNKFLPTGKIPNRSIIHSDAADLPITVPFAIMAYNDGLDYGVDDNGNEVAYEDSPPGWFIEAAFETREEAEQELARKIEVCPEGCYRISENEIQPLYEFSYTNWKNIKYEDFKMTDEDFKVFNAQYLV